jgi:hypothetical protein
VRIARALLALLVAGLIPLAGVAMFQDQLLYLPARAPLAALVTPRLAAWPSAADFRGLVAEPSSPARATAIVFHGNAGHAGHRSDYADALTRLGLRVVLAEYPGYGPRDGALGEQSLVADAAASLALAKARYGAPLLVVGESLGAGVAAAAAARQPDAVAALLLITPWDRLENVAAHHYPWLPVKWLLRDRYDSAAHLTAIARPVIVAVAADDAIVPARFGRALYAALPEPKRLLVIDAAGHNDWVEHIDAAWWRDALHFLLGVKD